MFQSFKTSKCMLWNKIYVKHNKNACYKYEMYVKIQKELLNLKFLQKYTFKNHEWVIFQIYFGKHDMSNTHKFNVTRYLAIWKH